MKRTAKDLKRPYRGVDDRLLHAGRRGTCWQAADGRSVQLAASENDPRAEQPVIERARVSVLAMLIAFVASGATQR